MLQKYRDECTKFFMDLYPEQQKIMVFGEGKLEPEIMMIGEAPGEMETLQGRPFVGKAGKNLDEFLQLSGLSRGEMYISNAVKFRPTKVSATGRLSNRPPTREEIKLSLPWLIREIDLVKPKRIVTLGNVPLKALLGQNMAIGKIHGQWLSLNGVPLYPLYHPASIIYNRSLNDIYIEDVTRLKSDL